MISVLKKLNDKLLGFYLLLLVLLMWEFAPHFGWTNPLFVPPVSEVLHEGRELTFFKIFVHIAISLKRVAIGFCISIGLSLPVGFILAGALPGLAAFLRPLMQFLSQIPPFILYPVFVIVRGPGEEGIYVVIVWSAFWPILFTTMQGIKDIDHDLIRAARTMKADNLRVFFKVVLPAAFPNLMRGVRTGLTMSFLMLIGAESMGADSGLGWLIHNAQSMGFIERIYLGALLVAVVGFFLNYAANGIGKSVVDWKEVLEEIS